MAIENLPTVSHVLAGAVGAFIALSTAWSATSLRRVRARAAMASFATRLRTIESELPSKASIQAVSAFSTRVPVLESDVPVKFLTLADLAIGTSADGRVSGVNLTRSPHR